MSLIIKAFLERNGEPRAEIRRFGVPADASASYTYIFKKIAEIFPGLVTGNFRLYWKDNDEDLVAFSSDEELVDALGFVTDSVFRVYIRAENGEKTSGPRGGSGEAHPNVICDGCESAVCGVRYKCLVCPDYDLCSYCEVRNTHPQHDMWKMISPKSSSGPGAMPFIVPPHFQRWMSNLMRNCQSQNPGTDSSKKSTPSGENTEKKPETGSKQGATPEEEYLRNVGETVAAFLDPLGIDVKIDVEHNGHRQGVQGGQTFWENFMRRGFGQCPFGGASRNQKQDEEKGTEGTSTKTEKEKSPETGTKSGEESPRSDDGWTLLADALSSPQSSNHTDPRIAETVHQMLLMGFNDDDGWLTRLVESKNGDISKVLDSLRSKRE